MTKMDIELTLNDEDFEAIKKIAEYRGTSIKDAAKFVFRMGVAWCYEYFGDMGVGILDCTGRHDD